MRFDEVLTSSFGDLAKLADYAHLRELLQLHCSQNIKAMQSSGVIIWRGFDEAADMNFKLQIFSGNVQRKSSNTENYYTLLMDNLPSWSLYPKRSESLICTTRKNDSTSYGETHLLIPFDDTVVGACKADDLWASFPSVFDAFAIDTMGVFSNVIEEMNSDLSALQKTYKLGIKLATGIHFDQSWAQLDSFLKKWGAILSALSKKQVSSYVATKSESGPSLALAIETCKNSYGSDFLKYFNALMNPIPNGFSVGLLPRILGRLYQPDVEVWFSGKALILKDTAMQWFGKNVMRSQK